MSTRLDQETLDDRIARIRQQVEGAGADTTAESSADRIARIRQQTESAQPERSGLLGDLARSAGKGITGAADIGMRAIVEMMKERELSLGPVNIQVEGGLPTVGLQSKSGEPVSPRMSPIEDIGLLVGASAAPGVAATVARGAGRVSSALGRTVQPENVKQLGKEAAKRFLLPALGFGAGAKLVDELFR